MDFGSLLARLSKKLVKKIEFGLELRMNLLDHADIERINIERINIERITTNIQIIRHIGRVMYDVVFVVSIDVSVRSLSNFT